MPWQLELRSSGARNPFCAASMHLISGTALSSASQELAAPCEHEGSNKQAALHTVHASGSDVVSLLDRVHHDLTQTQIAA